jgi:hypothetical protein
MKKKKKLELAFFGDALRPIAKGCLGDRWQNTTFLNF